MEVIMAIIKRRGSPIIVCVVAQKGGSGKSLYIINIASTLVMLGYKVLVIDTDENQRSTLESFSESYNYKNINSVVIQENNIVNQLKNKSFTRGYDVVLVDGKAGMTKFSKDVLSVSDYWLLPIVPTSTHFNSFVKYLDTVIEPVALAKGNKLHGGVVITGRYKDTKNDHQKVQDIKDNLEDLNVPYYEVDVKNEVSYLECLDDGTCIFQNKPNTKAAANWYEFIKEFCEDLGLSLKRRPLSYFNEQGKLFKKNVRKLEKLQKLQKAEEASHA
jgi:cellulose biosynthesis protein BcsQ